MEKRLAEIDNTLERISKIVRAEVRGTGKTPKKKKFQAPVSHLAGATQSGDKTGEGVTSGPAPPGTGGRPGQAPNNAVKSSDHTEPPGKQLESGDWITAVKREYGPTEPKGVERALRPRVVQNKPKRDLKIFLRFNNAPLEPTVVKQEVGKIANEDKGIPGVR